MAFAQALALITLLVPGATSAFAQQLSLRRYDVPDGLPHSEVTSIYQDKKGYIWFTTFEGLSRFDGYSFVSYGVKDGLPHTVANHVTEDPQGRLWVATNGGGVARLIDQPQPTDSPNAEAGRGKFITYPVGDSLLSNRANRLLFDAQGDLWCLTDFGLYRARTEDGALKFESIVKQESNEASAIHEDRQGRLWFGVGAELIEVNQSLLTRHGSPGLTGFDYLVGIIEDSQGRLLVAFLWGLFEFIPPQDSRQRGEWRRLPLSLRPNQSILTMFQDRRGTLWVGTSLGLIKYQGGKQTEFASAQGLEISNIRAMADDRDANLWLGTVSGGAYKMAGEMIVNYTRAQGLPVATSLGVFEDQDGQLKAVMSNNEIVAISGDKIIRNQVVKPPLATNSVSFQSDQAHRVQGVLMNFLNLGYANPVIRLANGREVSIAKLVSVADWGGGIHAYEDETGKLWLITGQGQIFNLDPMRSAAIESSAADFKPIRYVRLVISDRAGGLWIGSFEKLWRLRQGKFSEVQPTEGLPETDPRTFFIDSRGWLWIGMRFKGVSMTREPGADNPTFINYSTAQGLANDTVWSIAEDNSGRMYFGTPRGLSQFDPVTGEWRHYTTKDGLASDRITHLYKDRSDYIWVSTVFGVSKFNPRAERRDNQAAPIYLSRVNIAGEDLAIGETGAQNLPRLELAPSRNNLQIEFVALSFQGEENLLYQYQLEGVDEGWGVAGKNRSVNYARLAPGSYRFLARAVNREGVASAQPATFEFVILRPVWQRWWFVTLAATLAGLLIYAAYRYRIARVIELERVRTRIAADLHDDIGANLSLIAGISEILNQNPGQIPPQISEQLSLIAGVSRRSMDAMSDIVWMINPKKDYLRDLIQRMRRFASDTFTARNVEIKFSASPSEQDIKITAESRREIFLIFKEAVNNIIRHSECKRVEITLQVERGFITLKLSDNGRGFDPGSADQGLGLTSMQKRAEKLGGKLLLTSEPGCGAEVVLKAPIGRGLV